MAAEAQSTMPRTLVLCFDGTTNQYDSDNTNVVKLFSLLQKDNMDEQLCYYQPGVGTYFNPGVVSPLFEWGARLMDNAIAWYLDAHIMDGYRYVMQNYRNGDKICIFGFSRGAYTARALAGFLHKAGLLPRDNQEQIPFAYKLYQRIDAAGLALCKGYKQTYCRNVKIEFIGVWDTVASVGMISGSTLPFVTSNTAIRTFRHALSLDERRCKFEPNTYHRAAPNLNGAKKDPEHATPVIKQNGERRQSLQQPKKSVHDKLRFKPDPAPFEEDEEGDPCDALEVWFSGCHSDVGGGAVTNQTQHSLANITLQWMVREVIASGCGILFDNAALARCHIPSNVGPLLQEIQNTPARPEFNPLDAVQPLDDELVRNPLWWILEIMPMMFSWQDGDGAWHKKIRINFGRGRTIYQHQPKFHRSVQLRMADPTLKYQPKATWEKGKEIYVD